MDGWIARDSNLQSERHEVIKPCFRKCVMNVVVKSANMINDNLTVTTPLPKGQQSNAMLWIPN